MSVGSEPSIGTVNPTDAWRILGEDSKATLIDVRTHAEWGFVGVPDLSELDQTLVCVEWARFPDMSINPRFVAELEEQLAGREPTQFLFLCRSGVRSLRAAKAVAQHLSDQGRAAHCLNVAEGFEGDLDLLGHRGTNNGWKARGLAWRQS